MNYNELLAYYKDHFSCVYVDKKTLTLTLITW